MEYSHNVKFPQMNFDAAPSTLSNSQSIYVKRCVPIKVDASTLKIVEPTELKNTMKRAQDFLDWYENACVINCDNSKKLIPVDELLQSKNVDIILSEILKDSKNISNLESHTDSNIPENFTPNKKRKYADIENGDKKPNKKFYKKFDRETNAVKKLDKNKERQIIANQVQQLIRKNNFGEERLLLCKSGHSDIYINGDLIEKKFYNKKIAFNEIAIYTIIWGRSEIKYMRESNFILQYRNCKMYDDSIFLKLERCDINLRDFALNYKQLFLRVRNKIVLGVSAAMNLLHKFSIVHCDIKEANIFITVHRNYDLNTYDYEKIIDVRLGDFSAAWCTNSLLRNYHKMSDNYLLQNCQPIEIRAPEFLSEYATKFDDIINPNIDVWSFGHLLLTIYGDRKIINNYRNKYKESRNPLINICNAYKYLFDVNLTVHDLYQQICAIDFIKIRLGVYAAIPLLTEPVKNFNRIISRCLTPRTTLFSFNIQTEKKPKYRISSQKLYDRLKETFDWIEL